MTRVWNICSNKYYSLHFATNSHYYGMWPCSGFWHFLIPIRDFGPIHLFFFWISPAVMSSSYWGRGLFTMSKIPFQVLTNFGEFLSIEVFTQRCSKKEYLRKQSGLCIPGWGDCFCRLLPVLMLLLLFGERCSLTVTLIDFFFFFVSLFETLKLQRFWIYTVKNSNND